MQNAARLARLPGFIGLDALIALLDFFAIRYSNSFIFTPRLP